MAEPLLQAQIDIDAPPAKVWALISEQKSRHAESGVKPTSNFMVGALFGGVPSFERELVDGMNDSLARIKAAAETG
jgi:hypothetical protein